MNRAALNQPSRPNADSAAPAHRTTIRPPSRTPGLGLAEFWRLLPICLVLTKRNLMVRYRQTLVGAAWALLQPLLLMAVFTVFFGLLARIPSEHLPYPVFFLIGLVPWQMASKILTEGSTSVVNNAVLVTRVYLPRAYFPTSVALASLVDLVLATFALAILLGLYGIIPGPLVLLAPLFFAIAWLTSLGIAYWLSALNVAFRDITQLLPFLAQLWMFASPIIYPSSLVPEAYRLIYFLNPLALVIEGLRWSVSGAAPPPLDAWVVSSAVALILFVTGYMFFRQREATFSDVI